MRFDGAARRKSLILKSVWKTDEMRITHEDEEFREEVMKEEETLLRQCFLVIDVMM